MSYQQWLESIKDLFAQIAGSFAQHLPGILGALVLILVGWIIARLLRALVVRVTRSFDWLLRNDTARGAMQRLGVKQTGGEVVGGLVFWAVVLFFSAAATEMLGFPVIATWFAGLVYYLPRILVAIFIVLAGLLVGRLASNGVERAAGAVELAYADKLGRVAHGVIVLVAVVTASEQVGIDTALLTATITIVLGAVIGGAALSFALGSRVQAGNIIAAHYVREAYEVGQTVRVAGAQGRIVDFASNAVLIETAEGRLMVPAAEFSAGASLLVNEA